MNFITVATPDKLLPNNGYTTNGMLWPAKTQAVVAGQFPTAICNTVHQQIWLFILELHDAINYSQTMCTNQNKLTNKTMKQIITKVTTIS